jgi:hypothetical protein
MIMALILDIQRKGLLIREITVRLGAPPGAVEWEIEHWLFAGASAG